MLRTLTLLVLCLAGLSWAACPARAEDITGRWVSRGTTPQGGRYSLTVTFDGKGKVETEALIVVTRPAAGSTAIRCFGTYKLVSGEVEYEWSSCRNCPGGKACVPFSTHEMGLGGPVGFDGADTLHIGPETYTRDRR